MQIEYIVRTINVNDINNNNNNNNCRVKGPTHILGLGL